MNHFMPFSNHRSYWETGYMSSCLVCVSTILFVNDTGSNDIYIINGVTNFSKRRPLVLMEG